MIMASYHHFMIFYSILSLNVVSFCAANNDFSSSSSSIVDHHDEYISDQCDWFGSKSSLLSKKSLEVNNDSSDNKRLIMPIYLRCSRGKIKWFYPNGDGLRVILKLGTDNQRDFRGCIRVARNTSRNVRIYIVGKRQLLQIFAPDDGQHPDRFRCFVSVNHYIALFIDSSVMIDSNNMKYKNDPVIFNYDLEEINAIDSSIIYEYDPECITAKHDKCSDDFILDSYCQADFVIFGQIIYYQEQIDLNLIEYKILPSRVHRVPFGHNITILSNDISTNSINHKSSPIILNQLLCSNQSLIITDNHSNNRRKLFTGKQILGKLFIECSIDLDDWKRLRLSAKLNHKEKCAI